MSLVTLDDVDGFGEDVDEVFRTWREAIEASLKYSITGAVDSEQSLAGGLVIRVRSNRECFSATVTTAITARVGTTTLGQGKARLKLRKDATLRDGPIVTVYNTFKKVIPIGTEIEAAPDGNDYKLIGADCPVT